MLCDDTWRHVGWYVTSQWMHNMLQTWTSVKCITVRSNILIYLFKDSPRISHLCFMIVWSVGSSTEHSYMYMTNFRPTQRLSILQLNRMRGKWITWLLTLLCEDSSSVNSLRAQTLICFQIWFYCDVRDGKKKQDWQRRVKKEKKREKDRVPSTK